MIRLAESKLGSTEYAGWCLAFIEDALEISNNIEVFGGDSAKESCELFKVISMLMPQSAFRIAFTNGLMSESMIIWFLFVYLEIGRKHGSKDDC